MPVVMDPPLTTRGVARQATAVLPGARVRRLLFWRYLLPGYVWDAAVLEGNPFTYPEVQTLLEGITVGGRKLSDERQILNLSDSANELIRQYGSRNSTPR